MSIEQLRAFAQEINRNPGLAELCASDAASDADDQARIAKEAGFSISADDLKNAQVTELSDEELEYVWLVVVRTPGAGGTPATVNARR